MRNRMLRGLLALVLAATLVLAAGGAAGAEMIYGSGEGITRAEWLHDLTVLFDMQIEEDNGPENYFRDVFATDEYYDDILKAVEFGVVDIPAGGEVRPDDPLTRMFAADTLSYCLGYDTGEAREYSFSDVDDVSDPNAAQVAVENGWFALVDGAFLPDRAVTKAEIEGMESSTRAILSASAFDAGHENSFAFADGVLVIPDTVSVVLEDMNTLIVGDAAYADQIRLGEKFIFWMNELPQAFIPDSVAVKDGAVVVTGRFESSEDEDTAITEMDAQGVTKADLAQAHAAEGVQLTWFEGGTAEKLYANGKSYTRRAVAATKKIKAAKFSKTFNVGSGLKSTVSVYLDNMQLEYNINAINQYAYVNLTGVATITGRASADAVKLLGGSGKLRLGYIPIAGGVGTIDIYLVYGLDGKLTVTYTADFGAGFEYSRGSRRTIYSFVKKSYTLETEINAKLGLYGEGNINLCVVKGTVWIETGAKANYKSKAWNDGELPAVCGSLKGWLYANMGYDVRVFGQSVLSDSIPVYDYDNSPVRLCFHWEDGYQVAECTRDPAETYFTTKWNSRFGGTGSGGGFDDRGNWVPVFTFETFEDDEGETVAKITGVNGSPWALTIPDTVSENGQDYPVVAIAERAFENQKGLHTVAFPAGLLTIEYDAFYGCASLEQAIIPDTVTEIGESAFAECSSLTDVHLPDGLLKAGGGAFAACNALTSIEIPARIEETSSGDYNGVSRFGVFMYCKNLKEVTFRPGITKIANGLLANTTGLEKVTIPETVVTLEYCAFEGCDSLTRIDIPDSVIEIGRWAFEGCSSLTNVHLPDSVTEIGDLAFAECSSLTDVHLPDGLLKVGGAAFAACNALTSIEIPARIEETSRGDYNSGGRYGVFMDCENLKEVTFRPGITKIANGLLANTTGLEKVTIPDTVTVIMEKAFERCASLTRVDISDTVTEIGERAFADCSSLTDVHLPDTMTEIGVRAFERCVSLTRIDIPDTVTVIGEYAFAYCSSLTDVHLPDSLLKAGGAAFAACNGLTSIEIPARIEETSLGDYNGVSTFGVFMYCKNLKEVTFRAGITKIAKGLLANTTGLEKVTIPDTVTVIMDCAFERCVSLTRIDIPDSVTEIGGWAFVGCSSLTNVHLPDAVTEIGESAFERCVSLTRIDIPDTVTEIEERAFAECSSLTDVHLPDGLLKAGGAAFAACNALTSIEIPARIEETSKGYHNSWRYGVFMDCENLKEVTFRPGIAKIANGLLANTTGLKTMTVPDTVVTLEHSALEGCANLERIDLPENLTKIDRNAFRDCSSLKQIALPQGITRIYEGTFYGCAALNKAELPENLTRIDNDAFRGSGLLAIDIPGSVQTIGSYAFYQCGALKDVSLGMGLKTVGERAFMEDIALKEIVIPDSVTSVGSEAFAGCKTLKNVTLSENLTQISDGLFANDFALKEVKLPYRVTKLGTSVFENDIALTDVTLLEAVESIGSKAFSYPGRLTIHGVSGSYAETYANANSIKFEPLGDVAVTSLKATPEELVINNGQSATIVLSIEPIDFTGEVFWETSKSGEEIISINKWSYGEITGKKAGTATLKITAGDEMLNVKVTVNQPVTGISIDNVPWNNSMTAGESVQLTANVWPDNATNREVAWSSSDPEILSVDENGMVTALKKGEATITVVALDGSGVTSSCTIAVPNALYRTASVDELESPHNYENNCTDIWEYTVEGATALDVTFDPRTHMEDEYDYLIVTDGEGNAVGDSDDGYTGAELAGTTLHIDSGTVRIQLNTGRSGTDWGFKVTSVTSDAVAEPDFILPGNLTEIGEEAFAGAAFSYAALPDGVEVIGARAFADCPSLRHIRIPEATGDIAEDAFEGVEGLTVHGAPDSYAQRFAREHGFAFVAE